MRFTGQVKSWNAERGFGFIEPAGGGQEIFLHISAVPTQMRPPQIGQYFTFNIELGREGRKRAVNVGVVVSPRRIKLRKPTSPALWTLPKLLAIPSLIVVYVGLSLTNSVSTWFAGGYIALSVLCFFAYAFDKSAAASGHWRTPEQSLLLLGLAGGWPGGLLAQQLLKHKSSKASFQWAFWGTVVINFAAFVLFHLYF